MTERQLQIAAAQYLDLNRWLWAHVPNEGKRSGRYGAGLKAQGLKRGVPDILIFEYWGDYVQGFSGGFGVALELKHGKNKLTAEQSVWLDRLERRGWLCQVCYSIDEVIEACKQIS